MRKLIGWMAAIVLGHLAMAATGRAQLADGDADPEPGAALRYRIDAPTVFVGTIESSDADGSLRLALRPDPAASAGGQRIPTEGYYLGLVQPATQYQRSLDDAKVVRVRVVEVFADGELAVEVEPDAIAELEPGSVVSLLRPHASTTALMQAAPAIAPLVDARDGKMGVDAAQSASLAEAQNRLKQIGFALHMFHDAHGSFPPAVVFGPDGKAWHSWRALLLPYLEETALAEQYSLEEPWNGPNNRKLLKKTPAVYRDPIHGDDAPEVTHFGAIVGKGTSFPAEGIKFNGKKSDLFAALGKRGAGLTRLVTMTDGTSNTVVIGSVDPGLDIAWTRPEDVEFSPKFPAPGAEGGFAAPYQSTEGRAGVFLFADGHVQTIRDDTKPDIFRILLTVSDGVPIPSDGVRTLAPSRASSRQLLAIEVDEGPEGPIARLVQDIPGSGGNSGGLAPDEDPLAIDPGEPRPTELAPRQPRVVEPRENESPDDE
jgi:prepilin-type processing-associated H-X9-DG protein